MISFTTLPAPGALALPRASGSPLATTSDFALALAQIAAPARVAIDMPGAAATIGDPRQALAAGGMILPDIAGPAVVPAVDSATVVIDIAPPPAADRPATPASVIGRLAPTPDIDEPLAEDSTFAPPPVEAQPADTPKPRKRARPPETDAIGPAPVIPPLIVATPAPGLTPTGPTLAVIARTQAAPAQPLETATQPPRPPAAVALPSTLPIVAAPVVARPPDGASNEAIDVAAAVQAPRPAAAELMPPVSAPIDAAATPPGEPLTSIAASAITRSTVAGTTNRRSAEASATPTRAEQVATSAVRNDGSGRWVPPLDEQAPVIAAKITPQRDPRVRVSVAAPSVADTSIPEIVRATPRGDVATSTPQSAAAPIPSIVVATSPASAPMPPNVAAIVAVPLLDGAQPALSPSINVIPAPAAPAQPQRTPIDAPVAITVASSPVPAPAMPVQQPAAQAFAAAMFAADRAPILADRDDPAADLAASFPLSGLVPAAAPLAVPLAGGAQPPALDLSRDDWMGSMIDHIETIRDDAGVRETRIRLTPDALGSVDISIAPDEAGVLQVRFDADTPQARVILAEAAPRLAEMAEARGLKLGGAGVDAGANEGQRQAQHPSAMMPNRPVSAANDDTETTEDSRIA